MARIAPNHRLFIVGKTRSGKSTLGVYFFGLFRVQRVFVDPKGEWVIANATTVRSPAELGAALDEAQTIRYVPTRADDAEWEDVYAILFECMRTRRRPLLVVTDECTSMTTGNKCPTGLRLILTQGAGLGGGHLGFSQRPVKIAPELYTEAEHIFVFGPPPAKVSDLANLAEQMGLSADELRAKIRALPPHGFLWYDRLEDEITTCDPLTDEMRASAGATARTVQP